MRFKEKVAVITGGGTGIGRAVAEGVLNEGGKVVVSGRRAEPLTALQQQHKGNVAILTGDIGKNGTSQKIVAKAVEEFGRLDYVVNNAATAEIMSLSQSSDEAIEQMLAVNVKGVISMSRDAISELEKTKGAIVNISSVAGQAAAPGFAVYAATKSAGDRLTKILANELGPLGIRVNTVAPGLTKTDMYDSTIGQQPEALEMLIGQTALRRVAEPTEVARAVLWLLSADGAWITGQILQSSGGLMLS